ncbi:MAG: hypothetical protein UZ08_BCD001002248 [Candidatus Parvibacillus calidus]|jgi:hypothetical protein|nr:MAG: hypothetical protein UZ08_BCD001002248 [Candidatus Parvibacillus calidus]
MRLKFEYLIILAKQKYKMRLLFAMLFFFLWLAAACGQKYRTAAGIRIGTEFGITVQQLILENSTLEGIIQKGFFNDQTTISVLFEQHQKLVFKGLNFYFGGGPHVGLYDANDRNGRKNSFGLSAIGGVEMRFGKVLASFDYKPAINFFGGEHIFDSQSAISLRYIIVPAKKKEAKWKFWEKKKKKK